MNLRQEYPSKQLGRVKTIYYLVLDDDTCPAGDFMKDLECKDRPSHRKMVGRLKAHADNGPSRNTEHERPIKKYGVIEFKTPYRDRLIYFEHGNKTIVTHGFRTDHKKFQYDHQYQRGADLRDKYLGKG